jgi:type IV pilus assembly protein PilO
MTLEELKQLNFGNVGSWPVIAKIGAMVLLAVLILAAAFALDWRVQWDELNRFKAQEQELRDKYLKTKAMAINLEPYKRQLADINREFGALLKQLPNRQEMTALLTDINRAGLGRGLQFELFKPASAETLTEFYAELPVTLKVTGSYHDIGAFASDVGRLSRIVLLSDLKVNADKNSLTLEATAKTFRYLDDEEVAAQQRAAKEKKAKEQKK